jgi:hypothetical protein
MMEEKRKHKRVVRPLNIRFSSNEPHPPNWNLSSFIDNISAGGVKFTAPCDLSDKVLKLEIQSPRWIPRTLRLEAVVLESKPSEYPSFFDIRAQFINVSEKEIEDLTILEREFR